MSKYPVEALLRPPVEIYSAFTAATAAGIAAAAPSVLMMPPSVGYCAAGALGLVTVYRGAQARRVLRYQRNLRRLPRYVMAADRIPSKTGQMFLGMGFKWDQGCTQRLRDTLRPEVQRYLRPRLHERLWSLLRPPMPVGGKPQIHAVQPDECRVWSPQTERVGHTLVIGTTRVGKSRLAEILVAQDIRRGDVCIVIDPKGDEALMRRVYAEAKRAGRENECHIFHLGYPERSARYNAVGNFSRITEVASRVSSQLPGEGNSAAFREFAWMFVNTVARALVALGRRPDYHQIRRHVNNIEPLLVEYLEAALTRECGNEWRPHVQAARTELEEAKRLPRQHEGRDLHAVALSIYVQEAELLDPVAEGLLSAWRFDRTYFDKISASLKPLLEKLTTGAAAEIIAPDYTDPDDVRPIFDWLTVLRRGGIVYVGLDAMSDRDVASAVGNSMFADLVSVAGHIYKHGLGDMPSAGEMPKISIHADEFNELIGDEFIPLLNKAGGAGFQVTAYTQTWSDIEARIGSRAKTGQITGNFNALVMFRVKDPATADLLTTQLPAVNVHTMTLVSSATDSANPESGSDFTSTSQDRITTTEVPMLTASDVMALPKGQAFALLNGGHLWKVRLPLPSGKDDPAMPASISAMAEEMARIYRSGADWWR